MSSFSQIFVIFLVCCISQVISECSKDGLQWNSQCLEYFSDAGKFIAAEAECQKLGGHLVSIHDKLTGDAVAQLVDEYTEEDSPVDIWVGGTLDSSWGWTDKTKFDYQNWNETSQSEEQCMNLLLPSKLWDADDCTKEKPFVCQIPNKHPKALKKL